MGNLKRLVLISVMLLSSSVYAGDFWANLVAQLIFGSPGKSGSSSSGGGGGGSKAVKRYVLGAGVGQMREFDSSTINDKDTEAVTDFFYQSETALSSNRAAWLHIELSYLGPKAQGNWQGASTDLELYVIGGNVGLAFQVPAPGIRPWVGGGYFLGHSAVTNPATSTRSGVNKLGDKENKFIQGPVVFGGIDMGSKGFGLRTSFDYSWLKSDRYAIFGGKRLKYEFPRVGTGLYFSF